MQNKVIGISGFARSGKDTIADYIKNINESYVGYSFAKPLKNAVANLFGIPREDLDGDNREVILPEWGLSIRQILQRFGTESMRNNFGDDFWIKKAQITFDKAIKQHGNFNLVISDVRFENEAQFCRDNGILIHVKRHSATGEVGDAGHASESGITIEDDDYIVENNQGLPELYEQVDYILTKL